MFLSEVDHEKYPDVTQKYRFQYVEDLTQLGKNESVKIDAVENKPENSDEKTPSLKMSEKETDGSKTNERNKDERKEDSGSETTISETTISENGINPWLIRFLDAENFDEKYEILCEMRSDITDRLIDDIAVVMDVAIPEGKLSERYAQLKTCVRTRQKYESSRFR